MNRILTAAACLALLVAVPGAPADASAFRSLPALPQIPAEIDNANERALMRAEIDRLAGRARDLTAQQQVYDRECSSVPFNPSARRDCQFRLVDLRRDNSRFRTDVAAAVAWFRRVAEEGARRRLSDPSARSASHPTESAAPDRRLEIVRAALAVPVDGWAAGLERLRAEAAGRAGDSAMRDALAYVEAMAAGTIAADALDDRYYRHGVRRYLLGDDWSAALAFARAARDNPDDLRVFDSYALAVRRQHDSPACTEAVRCVGGDLAGWAKRFGEGQAPAAKALLAAAEAKDAAPAMRTAVLRLRGAMIHASKTDAASAPGEAAHTLAGAAADAVRRRDWAAAADAWLGAWRAEAPGRAARFVALYDGKTPEPSGRKSLAALRAALAGSAPGDPFSGALTQAQIILLQR